MVDKQTNNSPYTNLNFDFFEDIKRLKKEMNAVILAHYYQDDEIQEIADFIGDSLDLSRKAAETDADYIIFCGVKFMAEVAKILSPEKTVLLPDLKAGCSLEDSCPPEEFKKFREANPDHIALTYINCSAEIKALSDIIVTSSCADKIVEQIPQDQKIIFAPDGIIHQMQKHSPDAKFFAVSGLGQAGCEMCNNCPYMRLNTIEKLHACMANKTPEIKMDEDLRLKAKASLDRMLEMSK